MKALGTLTHRLLVMSICNPVSVTAGAGLVGDRERQKETLRQRDGGTERDKERQRETKRGREDQPQGQGHHR